MITVTHTSSVIALGAVLLLVGGSTIPGALHPALEVLTGLAVVVLGVRIVQRRWRSMHGHAHDHAHDHDHVHRHPHGHEQAGPDHRSGDVLVTPRVATPSPHHPAPVWPTSFRGTATMGVSGGIIPCPEALTVLLLALSLDKPALGLAMIIAFSLGLAAVLVGLGLVLVTASARLERLQRPGAGRIVTWLPLVSAGVVATLGVAMTVSGLSGLLA